MYTGAQHLALMRGVGEIRRTYDNSAVRLWIVSIGYRIIPEDRLIAPYNATFQGLRRVRVRELARRLRIAEAVRETICGWSLVFFLLGESYLQAIQPPVQPEPGQRLVFIDKPQASMRKGARARTRRTASRNTSICVTNRSDRRSSRFTAKKKVPPET
jgi:hypothetical protein